MNKFLLTLAFVAGAATLAEAQYRPAGGEKSLEVNFAPLGGNPIGIAGIKLRKFSSQSSALRLGIFVGHSSQTTIIQEEDIDEDNNNEVLALELKETSSTTTISIQPGFEKHLAGTERLSPYWGGFLNLGYSMTNDMTEEQHLIGPEATTELFLGNTTSKGGALNLGLNLVAGFDYYIAHHLYLGTEIGFGFAMSRDLTNKVEMEFTEAVINDDDGSTTWVQVTDSGDSILDNVSSWQIGPNVIGQLRLGWLF